MVFELRPVNWLTNEPVPVLSTVLLSAIVGLSTLLQQIPLAVTAEPPSDVMLRPLVAEIPRSFVILAVVMIAGFTGTGVEIICLFTSCYQNN